MRKVRILVEIRFLQAFMGKHLQSPRCYQAVVQSAALIHAYYCYYFCIPISVGVIMILAATAVASAAAIVGPCYCSYDDDDP